MKKFTEEQLKTMKDQTDYERLDKMTEDEIEENSVSDEDSLTPSDADLSRFKKVKNDDK